MYSHAPTLMHNFIEAYHIEWFTLPDSVKREKQSRVVSYVLYPNAYEVTFSPPTTSQDMYGSRVFGKLVIELVSFPCRRPHLHTQTCGCKVACGISPSLRVSLCCPSVFSCFFIVLLFCACVYSIPLHTFINQCQLLVDIHTSLCS